MSFMRLFVERSMDLMQDNADHRPFIKSSGKMIKGQEDLNEE